ncbi:MAG: Branched-chain amino acid transport ATP-binding protein LivG, partial [Candidatus Rokubacteria bacterium]|nr:Branched-chain amino acid transport ATP-binding protein LivG [Candidatus Rokubacteria bacterium]
MSALLETRGLTVRFGGLVALDAVDVAVDGGETLGVIGPNGSGKTTFFNALTGLYAAAAGNIRFEGRNLVGLDPHVISRLGMARTFQASRLCLGLSVFD